MTHPLLGRPGPCATPIRAGGASGMVGSFGPTRRNSDGTPKQHNGLDLLACMDWPVFAAHAGLVTVAGWENPGDVHQGYGQRVKIEGMGYKTRTVYAHLSKLRVTVGATVSEGELIGNVGRTGNIGDDVSIPTHLHFEIQDGDGTGRVYEAVDPQPLLMEKASAGSIV